VSIRQLFERSQALGSDPGYCPVVALWSNARTTFGYEMRAVGANATGRRFAGISVSSVMVKTALLSGLCCTGG
jgi:ABC-type uncharacterized transport system permease subunit